MRAGVLSDPKVIEKIRSSFVLLDVDISKGKSPPELMPAMTPIEAMTADAGKRVGFATSVIVEPDCRFIVTTSGCGHAWERFVSTNYNPAKYLAFLQRGLERNAKLHSFDGLDSVQRTAATSSYVMGLYGTVMQEAQCHPPGSPETVPH